MKYMGSKSRIVDNILPTYTKYVETQNNTEIYGRMNKELSGGGETDRYPRSVITFASDKQKSCLHPTQKPLALCEYMIKTYTNYSRKIARL